MYVAIGAGAAALIGGAASMSASSMAADAQSDASKLAARTQLDMFNKSRADLAPWTKTGEKALNTLYEKTAAGPGEFKESESYKFNLDQGQQSIERAQSARGGLASGGFAKDMTKYTQGLVSNKYQDFLNQYYQSLQPYQNLATMGQASAAQQAAGALSTGQNLANTYTQAGNAQAAGYINQANAATGAIGSAVNNYLAAKYYNNAGTQPANSAFQVQGVSPTIQTPEYQGKYFGIQ